MSATRVLSVAGALLADPCHLCHLRAERGSRAGLEGWRVGGRGKEKKSR
jgi:hypothetical protein